MWYEMVRVKLWITLMTAKVVKQKAIGNAIEPPGPVSGPSGQPPAFASGQYATRAQLLSYIMKYEPDAMNERGGAKTTRMSLLVLWATS